MKKIVNVIVLFAAAILATGAHAQRAGELKAVASVDLDRYAGRWYEIARYPNKFQKQCTGNVTATYTRKPNGRIEVLNECLKENGTNKAAKGEAKIADRSTNAQLKVRFAPKFLSFLPFVWGNYWVIDLDPNYRYAVVGEPEREYLWVLSREPEMSEMEYKLILERIEDKGYDTRRLQRTPQGVAASETGKE